MRYLILAVLWILWCALHSLLISPGATEFLKRRLGDRYRFTRIAFNAFAVLSLLPVVGYSHTLTGEPLFLWDGIWRPVQAVMLACSLWLFAAGALVYDLRQTLGLRQIAEHESARGITRSGEIESSGILGRVRHPWYSGAILLIWARTIDPAALVTNAVLTVYLLIGTFLEERKLIAEFGDEYLKYRRRVPMLLPRLRSRSGKAGKGSP